MAVLFCCRTKISRGRQRSALGGPPRLAQTRRQSSRDYAIAGTSSFPTDRLAAAARSSAQGSRPAAPACACCPFHPTSSSLLLGCFDERIADVSSERGAHRDASAQGAARRRRGRCVRRVRGGPSGACCFHFCTNPDKRRHRLLRPCRFLTRALRPRSRLPMPLLPACRQRRAFTPTLWPRSPPPPSPRPSTCR